MRPGRTLALVPAKGASRRFPRKNVARLGGKTLLEWTVDAARAAALFERIIVSTEDAGVADEARRIAAEVLPRPQRLAVDPAGVVDVALHALDELEARGRRYETLILLLPTSPFRTSDDIRAALATYLEQRVDFLMSVAAYEHSPLAALVCDCDARLHPLHPEWLSRLGAKAAPGSVPELVRSNGAITIVDVAAFRRTRDYYSFPLAAYRMPWERSVDIDTAHDFAFAEYLLREGVVGVGA